MCLIVVANGSFIVTTSALTLPTPPPPQHAAIPPSVLLADRTCEAVGVITKSDLSAVSSAQAVISQNFQTQDGLPRLSAQRPQLRGAGRANIATPQPVIPAEAGRVREGDPATDVIEWID
ncbi:hypothetical protein COCC4DRAFT_18414 [Bipolaris maydis ATCC 48331]|uniref:CBS domain-containing protein n=2 Tax=Cochliobolus heterostrophus TaxID=5016 RepID=M2V658_COCH5|nr:uncharacterized protein COCC4DRAFT_18414 [Bipolaris maydis ATCC 48331]EMD95467.1 hypothetical protein COCHEDRAFT_1026336 [Bipolaris maydis C5]ENI10330.1 hypothetical protein COCC4DRAFT_18414 [Bipolaris maydis ATCC 48331]KAJ6213716.1 hypothetical protein PSV09DRAFT_1026336 [Bipolaris maydis]